MEIISREGEVIKGQAHLQQDSHIHFHHLFNEDRTTDDDVNADFLSNIPSLVNAEVNAGLVKPFSEKEIVEVIWAMDQGKAPGPNGFSIHFYKSCWKIIKSDLLRMNSNFLKKAKVGGCTNSTFLALIPKEVNPTYFDRFWPISLCNVSYKIMAKLLANRLKPLLGNLISPLQGGLLKAYIWQIM